MSLAHWAKNRWLRPYATNRQQVASLLAIADLGAVTLAVDQHGAKQVGSRIRGAGSASPQPVHHAAVRQ